MMSRLLVAVLLALCASGLSPAFAADPQPAPAAAVAATPAPGCSDAEIKADVPALSAFHEVIAPLWHEAWPNKDLARMKELLPQIKADVTTLQKTELPGILRDKQAKWDEGLAGVAASAGRLETALAANDQQGALDAAETLHSGFEGLVRTVRPRLPELDAYHQVLYRIYHYDWPGKDQATLRTHADELGVKCAALSGAKIPPRFVALEPKLREGFAALCAATGELKAAVAAGADEQALGAAVEKVHAQYQACERLFE
jgi:hypothetical protein